LCCKRLDHWEGLFIVCYETLLDRLFVVVYEEGGREGEEGKEGEEGEEGVGELTDRWGTHSTALNTRRHTQKRRERERERERET
jgi:hypothetical protein